MLKSSAIAIIASMAMASSAYSMTLQPNKSAGMHAVGETLVHQVGSRKHRASKSAKAQLQRVLRPHFTKIPITRAMRAAAGNPNMVVFDRRYGSIFADSNVHRCSFITYRGQRAMICES